MRPGWLAGWLGESRCGWRLLPPAHLLHADDLQEALAYLGPSAPPPPPPPDARLPAPAASSSSDVSDVSEDLFPVETADDVRMLKSLIQRHLKFTGSDVARRILLGWDKSRPHFKKVFPREYR